jgi:hypothetical protein
MKNYIYSTLILFLVNSGVFGQGPNWTVSENNFQYTMSFVGFLNSDGNALFNPNDKVAAFVNGQCRGVANLIYVPSENRYYAYLTVFSNVNNENINFKIYDSVKNVVKSVEKTINFSINEHYGNLFQAYSFASPALRSEVEILDLGFKNIVRNDIVISGSQLTMYLNKGQNLTALNAIFDLSPGANVYIGTVKQVSGDNSLDFTNPVILKVLSENQAIIKQWTIVVKAESENITYYKKDAVCYEGGSIKVLTLLEKQEVILSTSGVTLSAQIINHGQVIFDNLNEGTYKIKVGGISKEIKINLKK